MPDFQDLLNQQRPYQPAVAPPLTGQGVLDGSSNQQGKQGKFQDVLKRARPKKSPETPDQFGGMDPLQQRSAIATQGTMGEMDPELMKYYRRLMLTTMVNKKGQIFGEQSLLPVERQFLQQLYGAPQEKAAGGKGKFLSYLARQGHVRPKPEVPAFQFVGGFGYGGGGEGPGIGMGGGGGFESERTSSPGGMGGM